MRLAAYTLMFSGLAVLAALVLANLFAGFEPPWPISLVWIAPPVAVGGGLALVYYLAQPGESETEAPQA